MRVVKSGSSLVDVDDGGELVVVEDRAGQVDLPARRRARARAGCPRGRSWCRRGDQLLADGVERRVRDLGEQLVEVVEEQPGAVRQHGDRRVGAHRAERLDAGARHRLDEDLELLGGVAERLLALHDACRAARCRAPAGQVVEVDEVLVEPLAVGVRARRGRRLISSSSMMRPCAVSTRNMRPGWRRPFWTTFSGDDVERRRPRTP